jgi:DNA-binding NarL/FixJ family response regulator
MTINILLADDQELMRMGFRMVIESQPDMAVTARTTPDVVLMDVRMPEIDGVEATRLITAADSNARIIILTTFDLDEYVYAGLRAGASGFLLKDAPPSELLSAIRAVANGDAVVAPRVTRRLLSAFSQRLPAPAAAAAAASANCCSRLREASPTPRSPSTWSSQRRRSRRTSGASSPSSSCATASRSSSSPTRMD